MKINIMNEIKNKHKVNSEKKYKPSDIIPDEENLEICLNCPLKKCKPNCGRLKVRYPI